MADIILPTPVATGDQWGGDLNNVLTAINNESTAARLKADTNASVVGNDSAGNPVLAYGQTSVSILPVSALGRPKGAAVLDAVGQIPVGEMTNLGFADVGAAAASHQHALSDVPAVAQALVQMPIMAKFNTTTQKWPLLTDVTSSPTQPIIWAGDADLPTYARPGIDYKYGPRKSGTTVVTPTPPGQPTATPDVNGVTLFAPTVQVTGGDYNISANVTTTASKTFKFLQIGVRGPDGQGQDTGYNNNRVVDNQTYQLVGFGTASVIGTWRTFLAYSLDGVTWFNGPSTNFSIASIGGVPTTPGNGTPGSGAVPILGRSGLAWNSGVCDKSNGNITANQAFFDWRGSQGDAIMYFVSRSGTSFDQMRVFPDGLTNWPGYRVIGIPSQPDGYTNAYGVSTEATAFWVQYGKDLKNKGWDDGRTIVRLNWEANGNWFKWAWVNGGAAQFVAAYKNVVNCIRQNAPKTKFNLCFNRGNVNGGVNWKTQIADPLIGYIDIIGLDYYDWAPAVNNDTAWNASLTGQDPGLTSVANYCRSKGLKMSVDEWGVCDNVGGLGAGLDDPYYINKMKSWFSANADVLCLEMYFNINADGLNQRIYPLSESNKPNSSAAYKAAF